MAHLFPTQWAICPNGFDFWAEPWISILFQSINFGLFQNQTIYRSITKLELAQIMDFVRDQIENILENGANDSKPHFFSFPTIFHRFLLKV